MVVSMTLVSMTLPRCWAHAWRGGALGGAGLGGRVFRSSWLAALSLEALQLIALDQPETPELHGLQMLAVDVLPDLDPRNTQLLSRLRYQHVLPLHEAKGNKQLASVNSLPLLPVPCASDIMVNESKPLERWL
jgi:hypothetical protein